MTRHIMEKLGLLINLNTTRWLTGYAFGLLGSQIYIVCLAWIATQTATPTMVGAILAAGAVPRALLLLFGGALTDRWGPKLLAIGSDFARIVVVSTLVVLSLLDWVNVPVLICAAVAVGTIDALFIPAAGAMPPLIVASGDLARIQGLRALLQRLAMVAGPPLAALMLVGINDAVALGVAAVAFIISVYALLGTRISMSSGAQTVARETYSKGLRAVTPKEEQGILAEVKSGIRYVFGHPVLFPVLIIVAIAEFAVSGPMTAGLPLLAAHRGWGPEGLGIILAGFGLGATASALYITMAKGLPRAGWTALIAVVLMGPLLAMVGLAESILAASVAGVLTGICGGICGTLLSTFVLTVSDRDHTGRVVSLMSLATFGGAPFAYLGTGWLSALANPILVFVLSGFLVTAVGIAGLFVRPVRNTTGKNREIKSTINY